MSNYPRLGGHLIVFGPQYTMENDAAFILDSVRAAGYDAVEGGMAGDAAAYKRLLDERDMVCAGLHTSIARDPDIGELIAQLKTLECRHLCNSGIVAREDRSLADYEHSAGLLNEMGRRLADEGIAFHYHNHDFEFIALDGERTGMDVLLDVLDPRAVDLCVDVGWVHVAGRDPAAFLDQHRDRVGYVHLKDYARQPGTTDRAGLIWRELGNGVVDWASVMPAVATLDVEWALVEQDRTDRTPGESLTMSRSFLKTQFDY